jgi:hypothetical protein
LAAPTVAIAHSVTGVGWQCERDAKSCTLPTYLWQATLDRKDLKSIPQHAHQKEQQNKLGNDIGGSRNSPRPFYDPSQFSPNFHIGQQV